MFCNVHTYLYLKYMSCILPLNPSGICENNLFNSYHTHFLFTSLDFENAFLSCIQIKLCITFAIILLYSYTFLLQIIVSHCILKTVRHNLINIYIATTTQDFLLNRQICQHLFHCGSQMKLCITLGCVLQCSCPPSLQMKVTHSNLKTVRQPFCSYHTHFLFTTQVFQNAFLYLFVATTHTLFVLYSSLSKCIPLLSKKKENNNCITLIYFSIKFILYTFSIQICVNQCIVKTIKHS